MSEKKNTVKKVAKNVIGASALGAIGATALSGGVAFALWQDTADTSFEIPLSQASINYTSMSDFLRVADTPGERINQDIEAYNTYLEGELAGGKVTGTSVDVTQAGIEALKNGDGFAGVVKIDASTTNHRAVGNQVTGDVFYMGDGRGEAQDTFKYFSGYVKDPSKCNLDDLNKNPNLLSQYPYIEEDTGKAYFKEGSGNVAEGPEYKNSSTAYYCVGVYAPQKKGEDGSYTNTITMKGTTTGEDGEPMEVVATDSWSKNIKAVRIDPEVRDREVGRLGEDAINFLNITSRSDDTDTIYIGNEKADAEFESGFQK